MIALLLAVLAQVTPPPSPPPLATPTPATTPVPSPFVTPLPGVTATPAATPTPSVLVVSPTSIAIAPGNSADVVVQNAVGNLTETLSQRIVVVTIDQATHTVHVAATGQRGNDVLHLVDQSGAQADIPIRVAPYGGTVAPTATLQITGSPASGNWLAAQVMGLVKRLTQVAPGAQVAYGSVTPQPSPLPSGAQAQFSVPVQIAGGAEYLDVGSATNVTVQNVAVSAFSPPILFYDDDPERITQDGVLYRGIIQPQTPVRLYYYHDSDANQHRVVVLLQAISQDPTQLQVIGAPAGPNIDVMSVGHAVSRDFVQYKSVNQGVIVNVPQDAPYPLVDVALSNRQGIAGAMGFRVLSGGAVTVTVVSVPPDADDTTIAQIASGPRLAGDGHDRTGVFALVGSDGTYGNAFVNYAVGGPDATVTYGDQGPPAHVSSPRQGRDAGDYGVLQSIDFTLNNPTDQAATAYLYERPIGGVVRSTFYVNGVPIEMGCVRVSTQRYQIAAYALVPRSTTRVQVQTMTDGGSNYPLEVGITGTAPQPTTPPISAPDGCFPKPIPTPQPQPSPSASPTPPQLMKL